MRKLIVVAGCLALFGVGWCFGNGQTAQHLPGGGGSYWKIMSHTSRLDYIGGFMVGYRMGLLHGTALIATTPPEKFAHLTAAEKKDAEELAKQARRVNNGLSSSTPVSSLESAVSTFYGDYRNAPVCVFQAVMLSVASLAGNAATEQELAAARKAGAESGCR